MEDIFHKIAALKTGDPQKDIINIKRGVFEFLKHYRINVIKFSFDDQFLSTNKF